MMPCYNVQRNFVSGGNRMNKKRTAKIIIYLCLTLLVMSLIFYFSSQSGDRSQSQSDGFLGSIKELMKLLPPLTGEGPEHDVRKYAHMFEYFALGVSCFGLLAELFLHSTQRYAAAALAAYVFCLLYACSDEFHQYFIPGRSAQFSDVLVDSVGAAAGVMLMLAVSLLIASGKRRSADE